MLYLLLGQMVRQPYRVHSAENLGNLRRETINQPTRLWCVGGISRKQAQGEHTQCPGPGPEPIIPNVTPSHYWNINLKAAQQ